MQVELVFFEGGGTPMPVRTFKLVIVICTTENCDDMPTSYILVLAVILMPKTTVNVTILFV